MPDDHRIAGPTAAEAASGVAPAGLAQSLPEAPTATTVQLFTESNHIFLQFASLPNLAAASTAPVTTASLGSTHVSRQSFENPDGTPLTLDSDYFGAKRSATAPTAGPCEHATAGAFRLKVW
jgi:hypothetical protein